MLKNFKNHLPSYIYHLTLMLMLMLAFTLFTSCGNENGKDNIAKEEAIYYCPMHPEVTSNKPGVCPICQMDLVLQGSGDEMEGHLEGVISISNNKLILANVSTIKVKKENLNKTISSYSYLDFAEENRKLITARFNGRIEKLFVDNTGEYVKQGAPLFEIYSPDLIQAQNDYLIAIGNRDNFKLISKNDSDDENPLIKSAKKKLQIFGLTETQINQLENSGEVQLTITYHSPISGIVIEKNVREGIYVNEGSTIYDIANLSTLWNISEVYEDDSGMIKEGSKVELTLQSYPGEKFEGKVALIYPVVNPETRTVKVRSLINNKGNKLKPNMYGETKFSINLGESLVVPEEAILFTGERKLVYVKVNENQFAAREIETGYKSDNKYQVISGLKEGEEIAATGAYLIDSESQLRSGQTTVHQHEPDTVKKEDDYSKHPSEEMNKMKKENDIVHERDVKVASLDKDKDGHVYQCPMDWEVISDKEGICSLCKMDLERFTVEQAQKNLIEYP